MSAIPPSPAPSVTGPLATAADLEHAEVVEQRLLPPAHAPVWAKPKVASALGIGASVLVHGLIIGLGLLLIPALRPFVSKFAAQQEQTIIPVAELATEKLGEIPNPGMNQRRTASAGQEADASVRQSDAWADHQSRTLTQSLLSGSGAAVPVTLGVGAQKAGSKGLGEGVSSGGLAKFGVPGGGSGIGPRGAVFGNGGNAYRIVFICDGTGTMNDSLKLPLLRRELQSTISKLKPKQQYDVVFFSDGPNCDAIDKAKLVPAIPANNKKAFDFINNYAVRGQTNPLPAIDLAFRLKPELVYFLSDGAFDDLAPYDEVVARFDTLNADKKARVNTIIFTNTTEKTDDLQRAQDTMKKIATDNGGHPLAVDPKKLITQ